MGRRSLVVVVLCFAFQACSTSEIDLAGVPPVWLPSPQPTKQSIEFPSDPIGTKPIFHEEIDKVGSKAGVQRLRDSNLPVSDLEVRVWGGFGVTTLSGFILQNKSGKWSAKKIATEFLKPSTFKYRATELSEPSTGWNKAWERLLEHGLLTLPDSDKIKCSPMINDGFSYVVEIRKGTSYRTYHFDNPNWKWDGRCSEADQMLKIADVINDDYRLTGFRWKE